jgi:ribosomal protein L11
VAKKVSKIIKLQIPAGRANPSPPVGTVLGPAGVNLMDFCNKYNEATKDKMGDIIPVEITVYEDKSFTFILKTPPVSDLLKKAANITKGSTKGKKEIIGKVSKEDIKKIAEIKLEDLNAYDIESAMKSVEGSALNMGIEVK